MTGDISTRIRAASWYKQGGAVFPLFLYLPYLSCYEECGLGAAIIIQKGSENDGYFDHIAAPFPAPSRDAGLSTVDVTNELYAGTASHPAGNNITGIVQPSDIDQRSNISE